MACLLAFWEVDLGSKLSFPESRSKSSSSQRRERGHPERWGKGERACGRLSTFLGGFKVVISPSCDTRFKERVGQGFSNSQNR